eukprot:scaffold95038_cov16-Prasinocladus_malaysianus.AAC.2
MAASPCGIRSAAQPNRHLVRRVSTPPFVARYLLVRYTYPGLRLSACRHTGNAFAHCSNPR